MSQAIKGGRQDAVAPIGPLPETGRVFRCELDVQFGDCDPAGIVFYPNFYRWFDHAVHCAQRASGLSWSRMSTELGWLGLPLAEAGASFRRPVSPGDHIVIQSRLTAIEERRLVFSHQILRDDTLMCEGFEKRFVGVMIDDDGKSRVKAIEIPQFLVDALTQK